MQGVKHNSVGLLPETSSPVSTEKKVERWCRGKPGLLFFTSEVCSLQASFPLQMQPQKGGLPLLPSPSVHPWCCSPAQPRFHSGWSPHQLCLPSLLPFCEWPIREPSYFSKIFVLYKQMLTAILGDACDRIERHCALQTERTLHVGIL